MYVSDIYGNMLWKCNYFFATLAIKQCTGIKPRLTGHLCMPAQYADAHDTRAIKVKSCQSLSARPNPALHVFLSTCFRSKLIYLFMAMGRKKDIHCLEEQGRLKISHSPGRPGKSVVLSELWVIAGRLILPVSWKPSTLQSQLMHVKYSIFTTSLCFYFLKNKKKGIVIENASR